MSENPEKLHIITTLNLDEVALVGDGGHQDAQISIKRGLVAAQPQKEGGTMSALHIFRTAIAAAMTAVPAPIARAMDFNACLQKERAHELVEAMYAAFYEAMYNTSSPQEAADALKLSSQQFADAIAALPASESAAIGRAGVEAIEAALDAADKGDTKAVEVLLVARKNPQTPSPQPAADAAPAEPTQMVRSLEAKIKELQDANVQLARTTNQLEERTALQEIVREFSGHSAGVDDDALAKVVRLCRQNGLGDTIKAVIVRANASAAALSEQRTHVNPAADAANGGKTALQEAEGLAAVIRAANPKLTQEQCMAQVWAQNPELVRRYRAGL